jgi:hypothetical protein
MEALRGNPAEEHFEILQETVKTLLFLLLELERKDATIGRLREWLFVASTERTDQVCPEAKAGSATSGTEGAKAAPEKRLRHEGGSHGRNSREDFPGAQRVKAPIANLKPGDPCPECHKGKIYPLPTPKVLIRVMGMAPIEVTLFELERMRCNLCGEVFTAGAPEGVGPEKYDASVVAMVGLLKYDTGLAFNRLEKLQRALGNPLPASTQWELVEGGAEQLEPARAELIRQAAQVEILHNDDTTMRTLALPPMLPPNAGEQERGRVGVYTSGIIARAQGHTIALFVSGHQHAGENLADVLRYRAEELPPPIHMCDALPRNQKGIRGTLLAHCLAHARRNFVDVEPGFPEELRHVLMAVRELYHHDSLARRQALDPVARLRYYQYFSGQIMRLPGAMGVGPDGRETGRARHRSGQGHRLHAEAQPTEVMGFRRSLHARLRQGHGTTGLPSPLFRPQGRHDRGCDKDPACHKGCLVPASSHEPVPSGECKTRVAWEDHAALTEPACEAAVMC